ncbi:hypothetical protein [Cerasicoccus arenae]|uniref:Lipoprotein n=1 Tax=Cerasicoccus arenae TaxID=424488 RepID=A0A8J3DCX4_9BACT|nr:hypothetical protein [Cerasicoccus arenae]MBK1859762.1 hypothetical protein [Cerasicoccus arenae]GHB90972.1 hypothetical protein GCM10007047_02320 [Cerasicoccus arenae]
MKTYVSLFIALLLAGCVTGPEILTPLPYQGYVLQCVVFKTSEAIESPTFEVLKLDSNAELIVLPGVILQENQPQDINLFMPNGDELAISIAEFNPKYIKDRGTALVSFTYGQRLFSNTHPAEGNADATFTQRRQIQSSLMLQPDQWKSVGSVRNKDGGEYYFVRLTSPIKTLPGGAK